MSAATTTPVLYDAVAARTMLYLDDYISLKYAWAQNAIGALELTLPERYDFRLFPLDSTLALFRRADAQHAPYLELETLWFVRSVTRVVLQNGERVLIVRARSANSLLARRIVKYAAGTSYSEKSANADNMMKAIVRENLGALVTEADRGISTYLGVDPNTTQAVSISKGFAWRNVLLVLQEIAQTSYDNGFPLYFDIVCNGFGVLPSLQFKTWTLWRGSDRRQVTANVSVAGVVLSPQTGTIAELSWGRDHTDEITVAYAGGQGEGLLRYIASATATTRRYESPFNRCEAFIDARNSQTTASVDAEADGLLQSGRPKRIFAGRVVDTPNLRYGVEWQWGDLLAATLDNELVPVRVETLQVQVDKNVEQITVGLRASD